MEMEEPILSFEGEWRFLSNFALSPLEIGERRFLTVEHAYQAAKTVSLEEQEAIRLAETPGKAKRLGRKATIRPDWERMKVTVMFELLMLKFSQEPLRSQLLATGNRELVEGNTWGDTFWGVDSGIGENTLGKLLMRVRERISNEPK